VIVRYALENAPVRFSRPHRSMAATMRADYVEETSVATTFVSMLPFNAHIQLDEY